MSFTFNGTEPEAIIFNGTEVESVVINGVEVWTGKLLTLIKNGVVNTEVLTGLSSSEFDSDESKYVTPTGNCSDKSYTKVVCDNPSYNGNVAGYVISKHLYTPSKFEVPIDAKKLCIEGIATEATTSRKTSTKFMVATHYNTYGYNESDVITAGEFKVEIDVENYQGQQVYLILIVHAISGTNNRYTVTYETTNMYFE